MKFIPSGIKTPARQLFVRSKRFDERIRALGIDAVRIDDCFLASYPKSGNTWVRFILASILYPDAALSFRNIDSFIPDPERAKFDIETLASPRIIKTHLPYFDLFARCIYIIRDPRDVFVSYYHYCVNNGWFTGSIDEFSSVKVPYGDWGDHVEGALAEQTRRPNTFFLLRYEDLLVDALSCTRQIVQFLNVVTISGAVEAAVEKSSFSALREVEHRHGPETGTTGKFFREGKSGQWRTALPPIVADRLSKQYGSFIERFGYDRD